MENYVCNTQFPQISDIDKKSLDSPLSLEEIKIAAHQMKRAKCPGLDGLPIEFYTKFWSDLKYSLHSVYLRALDEGKLNKTARQGVISLLKKPQQKFVGTQKLAPVNYAMLRL